MKTQQRLLAAVALSLILADPALAQAQYTFTTIDVPDAFRTTVNASSPHALVGEFQYVRFGPTHGFLLNKGVYTTIDAPDAVYTTVYGINARADISGYFTDEDNITHGFIRSQKGAFTTLDPPGSIHTFADGISASGEVVGVYRDAAGTRHGFTWKGGVYTLLDDVPGAGGRNGGTIPLGINDHGEIVGDYTTSPDGIFLIRHGFVESDGTYTPINVPGAWFTVATGIDNAGVIVGAFIDFAQHGYVLIDGVYTTIDVAGPYSQTAVESINSEGHIAGFYTGADGKTHGFVGTPVGD